MPIERVNTAERSVARFGPFAGPVLGGVLITLIGASNVMFLDSATFAMSAILIAAGVPSSRRVDLRRFFSASLGAVPAASQRFGPIGSYVRPVAGPLPLEVVGEVRE